MKFRRCEKPIRILEANSDKIDSRIYKRSSIYMMHAWIWCHRSDNQSLTMSHHSWRLKFLLSVLMSYGSICCGELLLTAHIMRSVKLSCAFWAFLRSHAWPNFLLLCTLLLLFLTTIAAVASTSETRVRLFW